jgi:hypothetical protein
MPDLQSIIKEQFAELKSVMDQVSDTEYCAPSGYLSNASIGAHVRHILEMFQCLLAGYEPGIVNYDKRPRNLTIETNRRFALDLMAELVGQIRLPDRALVLEACFGKERRTLIIESNFERELLYNLEHTIHHMALIKVGIAELTSVVVSERFGVAPSTLQYRAACVQ